jgi:ubiquitin-protein ligase
MSVSSSIASETVLKPDAIRRLMNDYKDLIKSPIALANAMPIDDADLKVWKCVVVGADGPYKDVPVYFTLEFPSNYPNTAPYAYFNSPIEYDGGASIKDSKGRSVCLDLFGNFSKIHTEWASQSSGWSPAYNVKTILLQMQSAIMDKYLDTSKESVSKLKNYKVPDELKMDIPTDSTDTKLSEIILDMSQCYITGTLINTPGEVFGYGISAGRQLNSPCEILSEKAFSSGTRKSTTNQSFDIFLPLYINKDHWEKNGLEKKALNAIDHIYKQKTNNNQGNKNVYSEEKIFEVLSSLMNSSVVEVMKVQENKTANDKFIDAYFAFYRLLIEFSKTCPNLKKMANYKIDQFLGNINNRTKTQVPNLGEWLIYLLITDKYKWIDVASCFIEECDIRNVFWYVKGNRNNPPKYPELNDKSVRFGRTNKVFTATNVSRQLVCFQIRFIQDAQKIDIKSLDEKYGCVPNEVKQSLKEIYKTIIGISNWNEHFEWCGMRAVSEDERCDQLIRALQLSNQLKYT